MQLQSGVTDLIAVVGQSRRAVKDFAAAELTTSQVQELQAKATSVAQALVGVKDWSASSSRNSAASNQRNVKELVTDIFDSVKRHTALARSLLVFDSVSNHSASQCATSFAHVIWPCC